MSQTLALRLRQIGRPAYTSQAQRLFSYMNPAPTQEYKDIYNYWIRFLIDNDVFDNVLDGLWFFDQYGNVQNMINPDRTTTFQNSPDVEPNAGTKGDGTSAQGVNTFHNPTTAVGRKGTQDSYTIAGYILTDSALTNADFGTGTTLRVISRFTDGTMNIRVNSSNAATWAVDNSTGFFLASRESSTHVHARHNDITSGLLSSVSTTLSSNNVTLGYASTSISTRRQAMLIVGAGTTVAQGAILNEFANGFMQDLGVAIEASITIYEPSGSPVWVPYRVFSEDTAKLQIATNTTGKEIRAEITAEGDPSTVIADQLVVASTVPGTYNVEVTGLSPASNLKARAYFSDLSASTSRTNSNFAIGYNHLVEGDSSGIRATTIIVAPPALVGDVHRFTGGTFTSTSVTLAGSPLISSARVGTERGGPYGGDASVYMANYLYAEAAQPFNFYYLGLPGTPLTNWLQGGTPIASITPYNGYDATINSLTSTLIRGAPGLDQIDMAHYWGGVADADIVDGRTKEQYKDECRQYIEQRRAMSGKSNLPITMHAVGSSLGNGSTIVVTDDSMNAIREAQLEIYEEYKNDNFYLNSCSASHERVDDIGHWTIDYQVYAAMAMGRNILKHMGLATHGAQGPRILSVTVTGNTFEVTCELAGGTTLKGKTSDSNLTGVTIEIDGTARNVTTCAIVSATKFGGTFDGAAILSTGRLYYMYGHDPVKTNPICDDDVLYLPAYPGIPLRATSDWITVTIVP